VLDLASGSQGHLVIVSFRKRWRSRISRYGGRGTFPDVLNRCIKLKLERSISQIHIVRSLDRSFKLLSSLIAMSSTSSTGPCKQPQHMVR